MFVFSPYRQINKLYFCVDNMKEIVVMVLEKELKGKLKTDEIENFVEIPPNSELGDYAFPCFSLAKIEKKSPLMIAESLVESIRKTGLPKEISGLSSKAGYVNFFIDKKIIAESVLKKVFEKDFGKGKQSILIMIDYSAPNVAKHFGIHNLRSTLIGHALYNILELAGNKVFSTNYLGDWGTQFGKLIVAFNEWGDAKKLKSIEYLNMLYVKFHDECDKSEMHKREFEEKARSEFKKLEDGDKKNLKLWKKFLDISIKEFERVYKILDIGFDEIRSESFYRDKIDEVVKKLAFEGILEDSEGARVVKIAENQPPCIIKKSDEASTYATRDLAAIFDRFRKNPDKILYVVDLRQSLHLEQVFAVAEKLGIDKNKLIHIKFGLMKFKDEEMSTRKGKVILFEELLRRAEGEILTIIEEKNPKLKNREKVARAVALSGIIFTDLQQDRIHDVIFDWKQALSFEGKSGPYILYTYARASSVLRKAGKKKRNMKIVDLKDSEIKLLKSLGEFPNIVESAAKNYAPHIVAEYTYELAQSFNEFYHSCPVIGSKEEGFRLKLVEAFKIVMKKSLNLLGIKEVEEM